MTAGRLLLLLIHYWIVGEVLLRLARVRFDWLTSISRIALAFLVGCSAYSLLIIYLLCADVTVTLRSLVILGAPFWLLFPVMLFLGRRAPSRLPLNRMYLLTIVGGAVVLLLSAATTWFPGWDGIAFWSLKGKMIYVQGTIHHDDFFNPERLHVNRSYPLFIPVINATVLWACGGAPDQYVRVMMTLLFVAFLPLFHDFLRIRIPRGPLLWVALAVLMCTPFVVFSNNGGAASTYGDVPLSMFMFLSLGFLWVGCRESDPHGWGLSCFFLAVGTQTKGEGVAFLLTYLVAGLWLLISARKAKLIPLLVFVVGVALAAYIPWHMTVQKMPELSAPDYVSWVPTMSWRSALPLMAEYAGRWWLQAIDLSRWGGTWFILLAFLVVGGRSVHRSPIGPFLLAALCQTVGYFVLLSSWPENKEVLMASALPRLTWHIFPLLLFGLANHATTRFDAIYSGRGSDLNARLPSDSLRNK